MSISLVLIFYEDLVEGTYFNFRFPQNDNSAHNGMLNG